MFFNEKQIDKLTKKFKRGWESGEPISAFAIWLDLEQTKLRADVIVISNIEIWELNLDTRYDDRMDSKDSGRQVIRKHRHILSTGKWQVSNRMKR